MIIRWVKPFLLLLTAFIVAFFIDQYYVLDKGWFFLFELFRR
jgi:hypothetical protein